MSILARKKSKKEQTADARRKRRLQHGRASRKLTLWQTLTAFVIIVSLTLAITLICFVGQSPAGPRPLPNQIARVRVSAQVPFSYVSEIETRRQVERRKERIRPTYRIDMEPYESFRTQIMSLNTAINQELVPLLETADTNAVSELVRLFNDQFAQGSGLMLNSEDILLLLRQTSAQERRELFEEGLLHLKDILRDGVYGADEMYELASQREDSLILIDIANKSSDQPRLASLADAASALRISLTGLGSNLSISRALFRILHRGLESNLVFDDRRYRERVAEVSQNVEPVIVRVSEGDVIIEPGSEVTASQLEMLDAYREELHVQEVIVSGFSLTLLKRMLLTFVLMCCAAIYAVVAFDRHARDHIRLILGSLVLLVNLLLLRLVDELADLDLVAISAEWLAAIPFSAPLALGAIILSIMLGPRPAVLSGLLVSTLYGIMRGNSMTIFLIAFLSCLVAVAFSRDVRLRGRVVKAGVMAGITIALAAAFHGFANELQAEVVARQALAGFSSGLLSGVVAIGLLPLLEQSFKYTTDITLLELTDFNHPLLRKMQMVAPGTYHHSLMVANLAERAASEIGANATLCRATCLFHDIGKMVKPEFFTENQNPEFNPHNTISPSMSAIIIKNHVKEGVQMAREAKLPQVVIDVIQQHHGTTLIKFFYVKAVEKASAANASEGSAKGASETVSVDEAAFRYEGPRPRTPENAIIFFADAVEAASRSLKKVNPQAIEDLVDRIMRDRIEDGQLDESPLTMRDLRDIRKSFCFTLQNMLHSRVEYPTLKDKKRDTGTKSPVATDAPSTQTADSKSTAKLAASEVAANDATRQPSGSTPTKSRPTTPS